MRLNIPPQIHHAASGDSCEDAARALREGLAHWFDQAPMRDLREIILEEVRRDQPAQLMLKTHDPDLRRLPWHLWQIIDRRPKLDIVLGGGTVPAKRSLGNPVRILAVFGDSQGINVEADRKLLEQLPSADFHPLVQPTRDQLSDHLFEQRWDIIFFAGHSKSTNDLQSGAIYINETERLTPTELKYAITRAGQNGLQLLILNSCDGLGIAAEVSSLQVPRVVVMREPVPDAIAQSFLKYLLKAFSQGEHFFLAVRTAREQLQALEKDYLCASWLPVVCQSMDAPALRYPKLRYPKWAWKRRSWVLVAGATAALLAGVGLYQITQELALSQRVSEGERILLPNPAGQKQQGVEALRSHNYAQAVQLLEAAHQAEPKDAETLIYLNNARIGAKPAETVAVVAPIDNLDIAQQLLKGAAQKQDEVNRQGGIDGTPLKIRIVNDSNKTEIGQKLAKRLVDDATVKAVIGHNLSDVSVAVAPIYQGRLVMITPTSIDDALTSPGSQVLPQNYIFRTIVTATTLMDTLADYAIAKYDLDATKGKVAICIDEKRGEKSSVKAFADYMTPSRAFRLKDCDLGQAMTLERAAQLIQGAKQSNAKALLLAPHFPVDATLINVSQDAAINLAKASQGQLPLLSNFTPQGPRLVMYGDAFKNIVVPSVFHPSRSPAQQYAKALKQYWGETAYCEGQVTARTALAYDALQVILVGLKQSDRSRSGLQQAISNDGFSFRGVTGAIRFQASGDRVPSPATLIQLQSQPEAQYCYGLIDNTPERLSVGEKSLDKTQRALDRYVGIRAFAQGDFATAIAQFQAALKNTPNDPEALIYLNNAKAAQSGKFLRIATSVPLDTSPEIAQEILRGVAQAQSEINQSGGIDGQLLQVAIASDDNSPDLVKGIAQTLVEDGLILAVVGHNASEATKAATAIYNRSGLVMITPTSFSDQLALDDAGSIFRMVPGTSSIADKLAKTILRQNPAARVAICADSLAEDNREFRERFITALGNAGGQLLRINCDLSAAAFDPKAALQDATRQGADTLLLAPYVGRLESAIAVAAANQNRLRLYGSPTLCTAATLRGQTPVEGLQLVVPWHPETSVGRSFADQAQTLWKTPLKCWREAMAYDATQAIAAGLRQTRDRKGLKTALKNLNFTAQGASGRIQFSQSGTRLINPQVEVLAQVQRKGNGDFWFAPSYLERL